MFIFYLDIGIEFWKEQSMQNVAKLICVNITNKLICREKKLFLPQIFYLFNDKNVGFAVSLSMIDTSGSNDN